MVNPAAYAENVAGHALVGCGASLASGGSCGSGALSAAVTAGAGPPINGQKQVASLIANAVLGGAASIAGKFANGAITGAFKYVFNSQFHSHTPVGLVDDQGIAVLNSDGNQMLRPSDVDPHFFVNAGATAAAADVFTDFPGAGSY